MAQGKLTATLGVEMSVKVAGVLGFALDAGAVVTGTVAPLATPWWTVTGAATAGFSLVADVWLLSVRIELARYRCCNFTIATAQSGPPPAPLLAINTSTLPPGTVGSPYTATATATGGITPYRWTVTGLPAPLTINSATGAITGTPTTPTTATVTIRVTDAAGTTTTRTATLTITTTPPPGTDFATTRVSVASNGTQANNGSYGPVISDDGRYITYSSLASNLVTGDTNGSYDIFVFDRTTSATTRVSVASNGTQANSDSYEPVISDDGRYITYWSLASNLVTGDTNGVYDIFVFDRTTSATTRVSVASNGTQANGESTHPTVSSDGRYITYTSSASNLVTGDTNGFYDAFVFDRTTSATTRVSVASNGTQANSDSLPPAISGDGRHITYTSSASNLVTGDTNGVYDIFVFDRTTSATTRVSVASNGTQANDESSVQAISRDGRYITYNSFASNLVTGDTNNTSDIFVFDRTTSATTRVSVASDGTQANSDSQRPAISRDGRYITYTSSASNLIPGDTNNIYDTFVFDRTTSATTRVSVASDGTQANSNSSRPAISGDGRYITYGSAASNLVTGDTNGQPDIFVFESSG
ncbi:putative Ig domain-containing protein [Iamia sp. SCSIO 61187]|uniref:TolB family protein n=1 Tax=Iamia sp. SCSIO 61187 TaxID=2722752 RepID=UPI001C630965|nr:putative Ig domain-containing protein [Iamia sp. SCSIO 61187]